jgi:hypothetical protein
MRTATWPEAGLGQEEAGRSQTFPPAHQVSAAAVGCVASSQSASSRLQAVSTEHWSLLTTRSLIYSESLSRVEMFLALLTGAVIGLALLAQVDHSRETFVVAAILILSVVLFVGLATVARLSTLNRDEFLSVLGMNRLRRAYLDEHPDLEPYLLAASHDDLRGVMQTMNMDMRPERWRLADGLHGLQTLPAMLGVIASVVAGVLAGLIAILVDGPTSIAVAAASAVFLVTAALIGFLTRRSFDRFAGALPSRFPTPGSEEP